MNSDETRGDKKVVVKPKKSKAKNTKPPKPKGKAKDKSILAPVVAADGPRYPLRSLSKRNPTVEPANRQTTSNSTSSTPLDRAPPGIPTDTKSERYVAPPTSIREFRSKPRPAKPPNTPKTAGTSKSSKYTKSNSLKTRPPPSPASAYLSQTSRPPTRLPVPQELLIVLDLNGTLIHREAKSLRSFTPRPYLASFLDYCFRNHKVMVWSSARPENVALMCDYLFTPAQRQLLVAEWGRNTLGLTKAEYKEKVQVYKRLSAIWNNEELQRRSCPGHAEGRRWGQENTILVDDGREKGAAEPWNLVEVPKFEGLDGGRDERGDVDDLAEVLCWIEEARWWSDVSGFAGAMGMRFEVGKDWGEMAKAIAPQQEEKEARKVVAKSKTPEVDEVDKESDVDDSDSDGGVKLPTR